MTCLVHIEFRAKPETVDTLLGWLRQILPDTRCREGCVSVSVTRNQDDPNNFAFVELWDSRQHYERYFAWRESEGVLTELARFVDGEAKFRFFDIVGL
ncbi:MAG: antibiotic biosynthesis monooxygenase [Proteobacteria bacterium]|jgi:quinol monooxygenase YgiN|nr:antibiotic biosynthesis monooxygenase [Pseudomonadota bacterium]MBK8960397.1 antibiotic biosynthesis monooxygenase [Pseudomonadota bacterium]